MQDNISVFPSRKPGGPDPVSKHNLPTYLTPLVGREQTVQAGRALLRRAEVRLVTLTGTGGVGKTRMALQIATDLLDDFTNGVCFVSLAPIREPDLVVPSIAQALGLKESGDRTFLEQVQSSLQDRPLLLLLDNFEQVVAAAPQLADLLGCCPELKILVTSRAVLRIQGEHEFPVLPLAVPDLQHLPDESVISQNAALSLFLQRARASQPDFQLTKTNALTIAEICARLDGLPLAIELAAARIKLLPPQALLMRLDQRLQLLTGGARDVPARQQTLRNTLVWSYDLLDAQEQQLFRRLSVFVGGCTLETAERTMANGSKDLAMNVLDGLASLIDMNLLQQIAQEAEEPRLLMLETIREFGLECLRASGELETIRQAHTVYFLGLAEEADSEFEGPQQTMWLDHLEQEYGNLRAAMWWLLEQGETGQNPESGWEMALRLGGALRKFWMVRGHGTEGRTFLARALAGSKGILSAVRAKALNAAGGLATFQGDLDEAEALAKEGLALNRELGDQPGTAFSLYRLGWLAWLQGDAAVAHALMEESLALWRKVGHNIGIAYSLANLADMAQHLGQYARAQVLCEESLALYRKSGNKTNIAALCFRLAEIHFVSQGDAALVRALVEEGISLLREMGNTEVEPIQFPLLGRLVLNQGNIAEAHSLLEKCVAYGRKKGDPLYVADSLSSLASVEARQGDYAAARTLYEESLAIARERNFRWEMPSYLEGLASVVASQGEPTWAARLWGAAEAIRDTMGAPIPPVERADYEHSIIAARSSLGEQAFTSAWTEGRTMTPQQALAAQGSALLPSEVPKVPQPTAAPKTSPTYAAGLTTREVEVLRLVAQGLTDIQVAGQLVISRRTVNWHLTSIYSKLGVSTRAAATRYAIEHKLV